MNDIFHFVERPYNLRSYYTLIRKRDHTVYHGSVSLSPLLPNCGIFYQTQQKILLLSRKSKQKLRLGHLTAVLVEYAGNLLREYDSFKSFHRFCTFSFAMLLIDHLHIMFLSCTSFSDMISPKSSSLYFIQLSEILNFICTGLDKFTSTRPIFRARNFTCAPDRARKKIDAEK